MEPSWATATISTLCTRRTMKRTNLVVGNVDGRIGEGAGPTDGRRDIRHPECGLAHQALGQVYISHYYNWKSVGYTGGYVKVAAYKLKADAPDDAVDQLSKHLVVPALEKLLSDGTILEYEIDETAIHTSAPGMFMIVYVTPTPEGLDTASASIREAVRSHPLAIDAFSSMTDDSGHRDELEKGNGVFK